MGLNRVRLHDGAAKHRHAVNSLYPPRYAIRMPKRFLST